MAVADLTTIRNTVLRRLRAGDDLVPLRQSEAFAGVPDAHLFQTTVRLGLSTAHSAGSGSRLAGAIAAWGSSAALLHSPEGPIFELTTVDSTATWRTLAALVRALRTMNVRVVTTEVHVRPAADRTDRVSEVPLAAYAADVFDELRSAVPEGIAGPSLRLTGGGGLAVRNLTGPDPTGGQIQAQALIALAIASRAHRVDRYGSPPLRPGMDRIRLMLGDLFPDRKDQEQAASLLFAIALAPLAAIGGPPPRHWLATLTGIRSYTPDGLWRAMASLLRDIPAEQSEDGPRR